jgi:hypothetical protein
MAARLYKSSDGKRVPSVTTILSRFKQCDGLMAWAFQQGQDGLDFRESREDAAGAGTLAHQMIESFVLGDDPEYITGPEEQLALAREAFQGFRRWMDSTKFEIKHTEMGLVSDAYMFGGTLDCIGIVGGRHVLGDWKSSNRIYSDYLCQLGGYAILWEEQFPDKPLHEAHLLRFGKEDGSFHHHSWQRKTLDVGMESFLLLRKAYANESILKKAVG